MPNTLSPAQIATIHDVGTTISALSLIGSTFILVCFLKFAHLRSKFTFKLVAWLSFTDIVNQLFDMIQPNGDDIRRMEAGEIPVDDLCYAQAAGDTFAELASVLWTTAIAYALLHVVVLRRTFNDTWVTMACFVTVCYGIPAVLALAAGIAQAYGPAGGWCYITDAKAQWRFIVFYGPLWICLLFNTAVYILIIKLLRASMDGSRQSDRTTAMLRTMKNRLQLYPVVMFVVWIFATINRIYEAGSGGDQVYALFVLQRAFSCAQGLLNAVVYGLSPGVKEAIGEYWRADCACCAKTVDDAKNTLKVKHNPLADAESVMAKAAAGGPVTGASMVGVHPEKLTAATSTAIPISPNNPSIQQPAKRRVDSNSEDEDEDDTHVAIPQSYASYKAGESLKVPPPHLHKPHSGGSGGLSVPPSVPSSYTKSYLRTPKPIGFASPNTDPRQSSFRMAAPVAPATGSMPSSYTPSSPALSSTSPSMMSPSFPLKAGDSLQQGQGSDSGADVMGLMDTGRAGRVDKMQH